MLVCMFLIFFDLLSYGDQLLDKCGIVETLEPNVSACMCVYVRLCFTGLEPHLFPNTKQDPMVLQMRGQPFAIKCHRLIF